MLEPKTSIIARSPAGNAVFAFDDETAAKRWFEKAPNCRVKFFKQTIIEEEITL